MNFFANKVFFFLGGVCVGGGVEGKERECNITARWKERLFISSVEISIQVRNLQRLVICRCNT